ncbi:hypothetical protein GH714_013005 [Hevea brasiliensis]|uniref:Uncharacterized protein n=1 Tax=Hevea brasiliensis TaxID=3981 RepID=A0A6A6MTG0_HEVBR|nr:hypothetical protein GH714_013005 [Hevea brasiliensis]
MGNEDDALEMAELATDEDSPRTQPASAQLVEKLEMIRIEESGLVCSICSGQLRSGRKLGDCHVLMSTMATASWSGCRRVRARPRHVSLSIVLIDCWIIIGCYVPVFGETEYHPFPPKSSSQLVWRINSMSLAKLLMLSWFLNPIYSISLWFEVGVEELMVMVGPYP